MVVVVEGKEFLLGLVRGQVDRWIGGQVNRGLG
jgi:hypothetical protein